MKKYVALLSLLVVASGGCGYRLGSLLPPDLRSIAVPNFKNYTHEPGIEIQVTNGVIERFQVDGTLDVVSQEEADLLLIGEIIDYKREGLRFSSRTDLTTEFRVTIAVRLTCKNLKTGEIMWVAERVEGEAAFPPGNVGPEAERAAIPRVVEDLAEDVVSKVVDAGW